MLFDHWIEMSAEFGWKCVRPGPFLRQLIGYSPNRLLEVRILPPQARICGSGDWNRRDKMPWRHARKQRKLFNAGKLSRDLRARGCRFRAIPCTRIVVNRNVT